jgi:multidrug efflux pump subunit AcrA (membrane-fusion protein)
MVQFRMKALNQMQKPDDLDLLMKVTQRRGWIALSVVGVALGALIVWGFAGSLPSRLAGEGVVASVDGISEIQSQVAGFVTQVDISPGQTLAVGDEIASVDSDGGSTTITAPFAGEVTSVLIDAGNVIDIGETLYRLEPAGTSGASVVAFVFVPSADVAGVAPGMSVDLTFDAVPAAAFGVLRGTVSDVDAFPLDRAAIVALLADGDYADSLLADGEPVLVTVTPNVDTSTPSGYEWSSVTGPPFKLPAVARFTALIDQGATRPVDLVFGG